MNPASSPSTRAAADSSTKEVVRPRDADGTRQRLLEAALRRFARDGYRDTTVRQIAGDAGVNVALINRYFTSKERLFEVCLRGVAEDLEGTAEAEVSVEGILTSVLDQLADRPDGPDTLHLLLLLRSSGDDRADAIRRDTLRSFAERMAAAAGWRPGDQDDQPLLRAQIALSTALGIVLLRTSTGLEPLTSASVQELRDPLHAAIDALLGPARRPSS